MRLTGLLKSHVGKPIYIHNHSDGYKISFRESDIQKFPDEVGELTEVGRNYIKVLRDHQTDAYNMAYVLKVKF